MQKNPFSLKGCRRVLERTSRIQGTNKRKRPEQDRGANSKKAESYLVGLVAGLFAFVFVLVFIGRFAFVVVLDGVIIGVAVFIGVAAFMFVFVRFALLAVFVAVSPHAIPRALKPNRVDNAIAFFITDNSPVFSKLTKFSPPRRTCPKTLSIFGTNEIIVIR
jgi:hypothetical protein